MKTIHEIREFLFDVFISAKCVVDFIEDSQNVSRRLQLSGIELSNALPNQHNGRFLEKVRPANTLVCSVFLSSVRCLHCSPDHILSGHCDHANCQSIDARVHLKMADSSSFLSVVLFLKSAQFLQAYREVLCRERVNFTGKPFLVTSFDKLILYWAQSVQNSTTKLTASPMFFASCRAGSSGTKSAVSTHWMQNWKLNFTVRYIIHLNPL